jgi:hypothetical protein
VALQRDRRFDKIVGRKGEFNLKELRGEIRALDELYKTLSSFGKKE